MPTTSENKPKRESEDILNEVLKTVRAFDTRLQNLERYNQFGNHNSTDERAQQRYHSHSGKLSEESLTLKEAVDRLKSAAEENTLLSRKLIERVKSQKE